jgi:hypothetical protein
MYFITAQTKCGRMNCVQSYDEFQNVFLLSRYGLRANKCLLKNKLNVTYRVLLRDTSNVTQEGSFPRVKARAGHDTYHSLPSSAVVKNE